MAVTIKDVANLAGVSTATVSYVINNTRFVSETAREKVRNAMAELKYSPNTVARSLRVGSSKLVGMVVPQISNPSFTDAIHGVEKVLRKNGYRLLISESGEDSRTEVDIVKVFNSMFVDGVIIFASGKQPAALESALREASYPTVFLDRRLKGVKKDVITVNNEAATREGVSLLLSKGHNRVALLVGPPQHSTTQDRIKGYKLAHKEHGVRVRPGLICHGDYGLESGLRLGGEVLDEHAPNGFFAASADMTLGALLAAKQRNLRIPDQLGIVGCHDSAWANATEPPLTMVWQPSIKQGELGAELLLKRIANPTDDFEIVFLPTQLTIREST
jgi:Transcriptional regulators